MIKNKKINNNFIYKIIEKDLKMGLYKKIHTRFPPEPNGYLHIGHAKSICINFGIAKKYNGKCNLRIDDTNPTKEKIKYIKSIKNDLKWLGFSWYKKIYFSSDYFNLIFNYAIELIKKGLAYVDQLSSEKIRIYRGTLKTPGKISPYRNRSIKENLLLFLKMKNGIFISGSACLRAKINMNSSFIIMRDPILYRIKFNKHHQTGNKWCIYPMYDFTHCISDALEGITHSLCTLEFQDNRQLYNWILNNISINNHPKQYEFSRLNIEYNIISKRKLHILIKKKIIKNWDDPRILTISGLRRKGYTPKSIIEFCNRIGITKQNSNIQISSLESCIRDYLNEKNTRIMAIINPLRLIIKNLPKGFEKNINMFKHPNKINIGIRKVIFSREIYIERNDFSEKNIKKNRCLTLGKKIRLRNSYVIKAKKIIKNKNGKIISIICKYYPNIKNKIKSIIHWVSLTNNILSKFYIYDKLFTINNPIIEKNIKNIINPNSLIINYGFVENSILKNLKINSSYQFERIGYFCFDKKKINSIYPRFNRTVTLKKNINN